VRTTAERILSLVEGLDDPEPPEETADGATEAPALRLVASPPSEPEDEPSDDTEAYVMPEPLRALSVRRRRFVFLYLGRHFGHASAAYAAAGYKPRNRNSCGAAASRLLADPQIREAIEFISLATPGVVSHVQILKLLSDIGRDETASSFARLRALELLAKVYGMFRDCGYLGRRRRSQAPPQPYVIEVPALIQSEPESDP